MPRHRTNPAANFPMQNETLETGSERLMNAVRSLNSEPMSGPQTTDAIRLTMTGSRMSISPRYWVPSRASPVMPDT